MTVEHRWLLDETPWPEQAALVYGPLYAVRIRLESDRPGATTEAVGEVTGIWRTTSLEPPKGYIVQVGEYSHCVTPQQTEVL